MPRGGRRSRSPSAGQAGADIGNINTATRIRVIADYKEWTRTLGWPSAVIERALELARIPDRTTPAQAVGFATAMGGLRLAILEVVEMKLPCHEMVMGGRAANILMDKAASCITEERVAHDRYLENSMALFQRFGPGEGPHMAPGPPPPPPSGVPTVPCPSGLGQPPPPPGPPPASAMAPPPSPPVQAVQHLPGNAPAHWAQAAPGERVYLPAPSIPAGWMVPLRPLEPLRPWQMPDPPSAVPLDSGLPPPPIFMRPVAPWTERRPISPDRWSISRMRHGESPLDWRLPERP